MAHRSWQSQDVGFAHTVLPIPSRGLAIQTDYPYAPAVIMTLQLPSAQTFIVDYKKRWKDDVGPYSANAYAAARVEIDAIVGV